MSSTYFSFLEIFQGPANWTLKKKNNNKKKKTQKQNETILFIMKCGNWMWM